MLDDDDMPVDWSDRGAVEMLPTVVQAGEMAVDRVDRGARLVAEQSIR